MKMMGAYQNTCLEPPQKHENLKRGELRPAILSGRHIGKLQVRATWQRERTFLRACILRIAPGNRASGGVDSTWLRRPGPCSQSMVGRGAQSGHHQYCGSQQIEKTREEQQNARGVSRWVPKSRPCLPCRSRT